VTGENDSRWWTLVMLFTLLAVLALGIWASR
jgi:LPXTG-motif cell wall-anchored protein